MSTIFTTETRRRQRGKDHHKETRKAGGEWARGRQGEWATLFSPSVRSCLPGFLMDAFLRALCASVVGLLLALQADFRSGLADVERHEGDRVGNLLSEDHLMGELGEDGCLGVGKPIRR